MKKLSLLKRVSILCLMLCFLVTTYAFANTENFTEFTDVSSNYWASKFINPLKESNIIGGYPDGTFKPDTNVRIDEFIAMIVKSLGYQIVSTDEYWAKPYIDKAIELRLFLPGTFSDYGDYINRQTMVGLTVKAIAINEAIPEVNEKTDQFIKNDIKDYNEICINCTQNVLNAYKLGVVAGFPDGTFKPYNKSNRAEAAVMISKIINPELRTVPVYDFETTIKNWYWVYNDAEKWSGIPDIKVGDRAVVADRVFHYADFELVEETIPLVSYKGINLHEMYEFGKYLNEITIGKESDVFYTFGGNETGYSASGYKNKQTYLDIFKNNAYLMDQVVYISDYREILITALADNFTTYAYSISLDKFAMERHIDVLDKVFKHVFEKDYEKFKQYFVTAYVFDGDNMWDIGVNNRNVRIRSTRTGHIGIDFSIKHK